MDDQQLLRYSRHILLPEIGIEGQQKINAAHALIVGAGGLGSSASLYLAASGVGTITLCDNDDVDLTNLQRQIVHRTDSIGTSKVASAQNTLAAINPGVNVIALNERIAGERLLGLVAHCDVAIDCSDNFDTRYALNHACARLHKPLVSGAAIKFSGQVSVFDFRAEHSPCYNCLYPQETESEEVRCSTMGVFAPLVGIIGSIQACETLKLLLGLPTTLNSRLLLLDALQMEPRIIKLRRDSSCIVCAQR
ncbi:MAG: HesA/MoeB/ThiF family protein [Gallionellaceae bacterium]|nr:MAG: HesA/MoeB/ThiF family protein [Gallionellaceae bacterium]